MNPVVNAVMALLQQANRPENGLGDESLGEAVNMAGIVCLC